MFNFFVYTEIFLVNVRHDIGTHIHTHLASVFVDDKRLFLIILGLLSFLHSFTHSHPNDCLCLCFCVCGGKRNDEFIFGSII